MQQIFGLTFFKFHSMGSGFMKEDFVLLPMYILRCHKVAHLHFIVVERTLLTKAKSSTGVTFLCYSLITMNSV